MKRSIKWISSIQFYEDSVRFGINLSTSIIRINYVTNGDFVVIPDKEEDGSTRIDSKSFWIIDDNQ